MTKQHIDYNGLFLAIDAVRQSRGESFNQVARQLGLPGGAFTRLRTGKPIGLKAYLAMCRYLNAPAPYSRKDATK